MTTIHKDLLALRSEVEKRVKEELPIIVLEREKRLHSKRSRECSCAYCKFLPFYIGAKLDLRKFIRTYDSYCHHKYYRVLNDRYQKMLQRKLQLQEIDDVDVSEVIRGSQLLVSDRRDDVFYQKLLRKAAKSAIAHILQPPKDLRPHVMSKEYRVRKFGEFERTHLKVRGK